MNGYRDFCPGGDVEAFDIASQAITVRYTKTDVPLPRRTIDRQIGQLRDMVRKLRAETRAVIKARELAKWQHGRVEFFDDEYMNHAEKLRKGGSVLDLFENLVAEDHVDSVPIRGKKRSELIGGAAFVFSCHGGEITSTVNSPFVKYLQHMFLNVGLQDADCPNAARVFIKKHPGVLD